MGTMTQETINRFDKIENQIEQLIEACDSGGVVLADVCTANMSMIQELINICIAQQKEINQLYVQVMKVDSRTNGMQVIGGKAGRIDNSKRKEL